MIMSRFLTNTSEDVRTEQQPDPCLKAAKTAFLIWPSSLMKDVCCRNKKSLQIRRKSMQKVRLRRRWWHRRDGRETPKGPHLIAKYTLSLHPGNIAAPSPSHPLPPGPRQLPYNLSYRDYNLTLFFANTDPFTNTHLHSNIHWHLKGLYLI